MQNGGPGSDLCRQACSGPESTYFCCLAGRTIGAEYLRVCCPVSVIIKSLTSGKYNHVTHGNTMETGGAVQRAVQTLSHVTEVRRGSAATQAHGSTGQHSVRWRMGCHEGRGHKGLYKDVVKQGAARSDCLRRSRCLRRRSPNARARQTCRIATECPCSLDCRGQTQPEPH
jgi:hypothetical protein